MLQGQKAAATHLTKVRAAKVRPEEARRASDPGMTGTLGRRNSLREVAAELSLNSDTGAPVTSLDSRIEQLGDGERTPHEILERRFNLVMGCVIVLNIFMIAFETDFGPYDREGKVTVQDRIGWVIIDSIFTLIFIGEMAVRMYWERSRWVRSAWNWLDAFIVASAIVDVWILSFVAGGKGELQIVTVLRIIRLVRLIRMIKLVRAVQGIYVLVMAFFGAMQNMFFIGCMIIFGVLMYAIVATILIGRNTAFDGVTIHGDSVEKRFGTVYRSMYSLFELMTLEGWDQTARPLVETQPITVLFVLSFVMIFTFGMLNMVVALVVEKTLEQTRIMEELKMGELKDNLRKELLRVRTAFTDSDQDGSGTLTRSEFEHAVKTKDTVRDIFARFQIDANDVTELFYILDWDRSGEITIGELVEGLARVQDDMPSAWDTVATHAGVRSIASSLGHCWEGCSLKERVESIERHLVVQEQLLRTQGETLKEVLAQLRAVSRFGTPKQQEAPAAESSSLSTTVRLLS